MREQFYGAIEQYSDQDYLAGGELVIPEAPYRFSDLKHAYNQNEVSKMSCTLHGSIGAVTDITHHIYSLEERVELWRQAKELGASDNDGWYIGKAYDLVRKDWNSKNQTNTLTYYRIPLTDHDRVLSKGYSLVTGFRGNSDYNADKNDGVLDGTTFGTSTYGHCIRIIKDNNEYVIDNYYGLNKYNSYRVASLDELIKNGVFFNEAYFFVTQQSLDLMAKQQLISDWAREAVEWCRKNGYATIWNNPQEIVANAIVEKMWYNMGILSTYTGLGITKERMAVILMRTHEKKTESAGSDNTGKEETERGVPSSAK